MTTNTRAMIFNGQEEKEGEKEGGEEDNEGRAGSVVAKITAPRAGGTTTPG